MSRNKTYKIIILLFIPWVYLYAQENSISHKSPPIPVEVFIGNKAISVQLVVSKPFNETSKWSYFNVTNLKGDYKNDLTKNEFFTQSLLNYKLVKGLYLAAGLALNQKTGFRKMAGLQYVFANKKWLFITVPTIDLKDDHNIENFSLLEFKPKLNDKINLYTRFQGLYILNSIENTHQRSYVNLRLGVSIKNYQIGLGADKNWYGPHKINTDNLGLFGRIQLN
jgi:hypothetical protein